MLVEQQRNMMRSQLIDSAVHIVANEGYQKATTKNIATRAGLNEVYIYRLFDDKETLISRAFAASDEDIAYAIEKTLPLMRMDGLPMEDRWRTLFLRVYKQLLADRDYARFYVRYYYSEQYRQYAMTAHVACYEKAVDGLREFFRPGEDARGLLRFAFESMIGMVFRAAAEDTNDTKSADEQFALLYRAMAPSLKDELAAAQ